MFQVRSPLRSHFDLDARAGCDKLPLMDIADLPFNAFLGIEVDLLDDENQVVASAALEWFASNFPT